MLITTAHFEGRKFPDIRDHCMASYSELKRIIFRYKYWFGWGLIFTCLSNYCSVLTPQISGYIIEQLGEPSSNRHFTQTLPFLLSGGTLAERILHAALLLCLLIFIRGIFLFFMRQTIIVASRHVEYDLKNLLFFHYLQLDATFYDRNQLGDLMNRLHEDIGRIRMAIGPALMYFCNLVSLVGLSIFFMWHTHPTLTLITLSPLPLLTYILYRLDDQVTRSSRIVQAELSHITACANESFLGIKVIQSFVQESHYLKVILHHIQRYRRNMIRLSRIESFHYTSIFVLTYLCTLIAVGVGSYFALYQDTPVSVVITFIFYVNLLIFPFTLTGLIKSSMQKAAVSWSRIRVLLQERSCILQLPQAIDPPQATWQQIRWANVRLRYRGQHQDALHNISLHFHSRKKILVSGAVGAGKSSLLRSLLRLYPLQAGAIYLDGIDITSLRLGTWQEFFSYLPQDIALFRKSIRENLALARPYGFVSELEMQEVCQIAQVYEDIRRLPQQWDSHLSEKGNNLSGGQKQRLSLARALLRPHQILLIDDALSAVDIPTEEKILAHLCHPQANRCLIYVAHRILSAPYFDEVWLLEQGQIVHQGSHQTMLHHSDWYRRIYEQQQRYR